MESPHLILNTCLLAGKIMMESGSEAYRVEDTMQRIAINSGLHQAESYVTATGIFMTVNDSSFTQMTQARNRSNNLEKITATNEASRQFAQGKITIQELHQRLAVIDKDTPEFKFSYRVFAAGISSLTLMLMLNGTLSDAMPAFLLGGLGYYLSTKIFKRYQIKFINDLFASMALAFLGIVMQRYGLITNINSVLIGALMPLVPGVALTSAMRDLFEGHLITGIVRGVEAILVALVIGVGIAFIFQS